MLVWQSLGCQLHSNAVVASVTNDFRFVTSTEAVLGCHIIDVTLLTDYLKIKQ